METTLRKIVLFIKENSWTKIFSLFFFHIVPNVDFYYRIFMNIDVNWELVRQYFPSLVYSLMTGILFLLYIRAQAGYYEVKETNKLLTRLNQLYKERFKMILFGDTDMLFTDFELELWRKRLHKKEPNNKEEVDKFVNAQRAGSIDYGGKLIIIDHRKGHERGAEEKEQGT